MHSFKRALLFTVFIGCFGAADLIAQRGGAVGSRAPLPSSTALGAGALSSRPSSTSRSTGPSFAGNGYGRGYGRVYNSRRTGTNTYRALPRAYVVAPYYYPFLDWSGATDYSASGAPGYDDPGNGPDPGSDAMMMNQAALGQQVQRLTGQVNDLMYSQGYQGYAASQPATPPAPPVTLVLRDGQRLQVQNYAVSGNTFWDFTDRGTRRIPISTIDLAASVKATQANGGEFPQIDGAQ